MSYWLFQNNQVAGPYTPAELSALAAFGPDSLVCPEGRKGTQMGDWQRAEAVAELAEALARGRVPAGVAAASAPAPEREPAGMRELAVLGLLQERIAQLESSLRQVQDDLRGREAEISLLKSELAQRAAETSTLSAETSTLSQQGSSLKESVAAIQAKLAEPPPPPPAPVEDPAVASARSEHERAIQELRGQIQSLESKLAELNSAHGALERQVQSAPPPAPAPMQAPAPAPATVPMPKTAPTPADLLGAPPVLELPPASLPGAPLIVPPPMDAPPLLELPTAPPAASSVQDLETIGGPMRLDTPLPQTLMSPSAFEPIATPSPMLSPSAPMPGFTGSSPTPLPKKKPEPELELTDLTEAAGKKKGGKKALIFFVFLLAAAGGVLWLMRAGKLPLPGAKKKAPAAAAQAPSMPQPVTTEAAAPPPEAPPPTAPIAKDPADEALELAKAYPVNGQPLSVVLEGGAPPAAGLAPWHLEKLGEGKYQVNFYPAKSKKPLYQFEADLAAHSLKGLDAKSSALLAGGAPAAPTPPAAGPKARRRGRTAAAAALEPASLGEDGPAAPRAPRRARKAAAPKGGGEEGSLDDLLLPGGQK